MWLSNNDFLSIWCWSWAVLPMFLQSLTIFLLYLELKSKNGFKLKTGFDFRRSVSVRLTIWLQLYWVCQSGVLQHPRENSGKFISTPALVVHFFLYMHSCLVRTFFFFFWLVSSAPYSSTPRGGEDLFLPPPLSLSLFFFCLSAQHPHSTPAWRWGPCTLSKNRPQGPNFACVLMSKTATISWHFERCQKNYFLSWVYIAQFRQHFLGVWDLFHQSMRAKPFTCKENQSRVEVEWRFEMIWRTGKLFIQETETLRQMMTSQYSFKNAIKILS